MFSAGFFRYFAQDPTAENGAAHIQGRSPHFNGFNLDTILHTLHTCPENSSQA